MLRSGNELNKPSFSKLRNTNPIGRISKRHSARRKEILRLVNQEYNSYISVSIAEKLIREINEIASYNEQTSEFVEEIREKMFLLHEYNTHVAKIAYSYPTSKEIYELLGRYVALESDVLYKNNCDFKVEKRVENRVFDTIVTFLKDSFSTEEDSLHEERKRVYNEALKVFVSYVDVKYTNDEEKFPARIVKNILDALGLIKKSTDNPSGNLDLNNPSLIRLKESLKDSDYGSDDDGQETASISSESSFRTMLFKKRTHEKTSKKDIPNNVVATSESSSEVSPIDTPEPCVPVQYSSTSTLANEEKIHQNSTNKSSQSSSEATRSALQNDRGLKSVSKPSRSEPVPNFPTSNEVFSTISQRDIQTFFDFNVDDDIEVIEWSSRRSKFPQPQEKPPNKTTQNTNKNSLPKINTKSVGGNIEYRIFGTISITGSDEEEEDFVCNRTDFDAIKRNFMEQKRSQAILNNLKKRTLEEVSKVFDELDKRKANKSNLASIKFVEPSSKEENIDVKTKWNMKKDCASRNEIYQSENKIWRNDQISASKAAMIIEISSSDEDEPIMDRKNTDGSPSITNYKTPLANTIRHTDNPKIVENKLEVGNNEPPMMRRIYCRSLDELRTVRNPVVPAGREEQEGKTTEPYVSTNATFVDLCSDNEFDTGNIANSTEDSDVEIIENIEENSPRDALTKKVSTGRETPSDSFCHSKVQLDSNNEVTYPVDFNRERRNEEQTERITNVRLGEQTISDHLVSGMKLSFPVNLAPEKDRKFMDTLPDKRSNSIQKLSETPLKQCSLENLVSENRENEQSRMISLVEKQNVSIQTKLEQCSNLQSGKSKDEQNGKFESVFLDKPNYSNQADSSGNCNSKVNTVKEVNIDNKNHTENRIDGNEISTKNKTIEQIGHNDSTVSSISDGIQYFEGESFCQAFKSKYSAKTKTFVVENDMQEAGENYLIAQSTQIMENKSENVPCRLSTTPNEEKRTVDVTVEASENQETFSFSPVVETALNEEVVEDIQCSEERINETTDKNEAENMTNTKLGCSFRTRNFNEKLDSIEKVTSEKEIVTLEKNSYSNSRDRDTTLVPHNTSPFNEEEVILDCEDQLIERQRIGVNKLKETSVSSVINEENRLHLEQVINLPYDETEGEVVKTPENQEEQSKELQHTTEEVRSSSYPEGPTDIEVGDNLFVESTRTQEVPTISSKENSEQHERGVVSIEDKKEVQSETKTYLKPNLIVESMEEEVEVGSGKKKEKGTESKENKKEMKLNEMPEECENIRSVEEAQVQKLSDSEKEIIENSTDTIHNVKEFSAEVATNEILGCEPKKNLLLEPIELEEAQVPEQEEENDQVQIESCTEHQREVLSEEAMHELEKSGRSEHITKSMEFPVAPERNKEIYENIPSPDSSVSIDYQWGVSSEMTSSEVFGCGQKRNLFKVSREVSEVSKQNKDINEQIESNNIKATIDYEDKTLTGMKTNQELEECNPILHSFGEVEGSEKTNECTYELQAEKNTEKEEIVVPSETTFNEKNSSLGNDVTQTAQSLDANVSSIENISESDKRLVDPTVYVEAIDHSRISPIKIFATQSKESEQIIGDQMNNEQIEKDLRTDNSSNNECLYNEQVIAEKNLHPEETVECSETPSELQYNNSSINDPEIPDCESGRQSKEMLHLSSIEESEKDLPKSLKNSTCDEQKGREHFETINENLDNEQGEHIPHKEATETLAEYESQEKIMYDDECTSFVIDEGEINENMENAQEETIVTDTETKRVPDAEIQIQGESIVTDEDIDKCEYITLHIDSANEIETTVCSDSVRDVASVAVEKVENFPLIKIVEKFDYIPVEKNITTVSNVLQDDCPVRDSIDMEVEVPFTAIPDTSKGIELTPKSRKTRCSDSHNVVGNLGKMMLLMSNNEPRRPKRNISFTSPIKMNEPCVVFDTSPTTSSKPIVDVGNRDPPYSSYTDLECKSTTNVSTFSEGTLSQIPNNLYSSNNFYSSYIPEDTRDKEVFLNIKECVSEKQQLDIDILASVASSQKPLKVHQTDEDPKSDVSNTSRNKRKSAGSKSNALSKKSPYTPSLDTDSHSSSKTPQHKNKAEKNSKTNNKSPKTEKNSNSPTTPPTPGRKAKIPKNKKTEKTEPKLPETENKEENKNCTKVGRKSKDVGSDKRKLKGTKVTEKSRTKHISSERKLIIDSCESDDSLPLNVRMKKVELSPVEDVTPKSGKKDRKQTHHSKDSKSKEKSKKGSVKKRNEDKKLTIQCTAEKESDAKTQTVPDKLDKNQVCSPPVKEDPSRRIVHFKKAMLELISLDENNSKNASMNESAVIQKPLITADDKNDQDSAIQDNIVVGTTEKIPSAIVNTMIIEPNLWNSTSEVVVEYKELADKNSFVPKSHAEDSPTSKGLNTSNSPVVKPLTKPYDCDERRRQEDIKPAIPSKSIDKNNVDVPETVCSISNTLVYDSMQSNVSSTEDSIKSESQTKHDPKDSSSFQKLSEIERTEAERNIETSKQNREELDRNGTIEEIDKKEENSAINKYDDFEYLSPTPQEKSETECTENLLDIKMKKSRRKNIENKDEKKIDETEACRSSDLKISVEIPDTIIEIDSSGLIKSGETSHRSSKTKSTMNEFSTSRSRRRSKSEVKNEKINELEEVDNTILMSKEKKDVIRNEKVEIPTCSKNEASSLSNEEKNQSSLSLSPAEEFGKEQKHISDDYKCKFSFATVMKKESDRRKSKKTKNLYDTKRDILHDDHSSIGNISAERNDKEKKSSKAQQNINKAGNRKNHKVFTTKDQEINRKEILSEPYILLEKLSTQNERNQEKNEVKTRRSKRKRSDSETSEKKKRSSPEYTDSTVGTHEKKRGDEKHIDKLAKTEINDKKSVDSKLKREGRTRSKKHGEKFVRNKLSIDCVGEPKKAYIENKNISGLEIENLEVELAQSSDRKAETTFECTKMQEQGQIELSEENKTINFTDQDISCAISSRVDLKNSEEDEDKKLCTEGLQEVNANPKDDDACLANKNKCSLGIVDENVTASQKELSTLNSDLLIEPRYGDSGDRDESIRNLCFKFGDVTLKSRKRDDVISDGKASREIGGINLKSTPDTLMGESQTEALELEKNSSEVLEPITNTELDQQVIGNETEDLAINQNPSLEIEMTNEEVETITYEKASAVVEKHTKVFKDPVPEVDNTIITERREGESRLETTPVQESLEFVDPSGGKVVDTLNPIHEIEISSDAEKVTEPNEQVSEFKSSIVVSENEALELDNSINTLNDEQESTVETKQHPFIDETGVVTGVCLNPVLEISVGTEGEKLSGCVEFNEERADLGFKFDNLKNEMERMKTVLDQQSSKLTVEERRDIMGVDQNTAVEAEISTNAENEETKTEELSLNEEEITGENIADNKNKVFEIEKEEPSETTTEHNDQFEVPEEDLFASQEQESGMEMEIDEEIETEGVIVSQNPCFEIEISTDAGNGTCSIEEREEPVEFEEITENPKPVIKLPNAVDSPSDKKELKLESKVESSSSFLDESEGDSPTPVLEIEISTEKEETCEKLGTESVEQTFEECPKENITVSQDTNQLDYSTRETVETQPSKLAENQIESVVIQNPALEIEIPAINENEQICSEMETKHDEHNINLEEDEGKMVFAQDAVLEHHDSNTTANIRIETKLDEQSSKFVGNEIGGEVFVSQSPVLEIEISANNENEQVVSEKEAKLDEQNVELVNKEEMVLAQDIVLENPDMITTANNRMGSKIETDLDQPHLELDYRTEITLSTENEKIESKIGAKLDHPSVECVDYDNEEENNLCRKFAVGVALSSTNENRQQQPSESTKDAIEVEALPCQNPILEIEVFTNAEYRKIPLTMETTLDHQVTEGKITSQDQDLISKIKADCSDSIKDSATCKNASEMDLKSYQVALEVQTVNIDIVQNKSNFENDNVEKQLEKDSLNSSDHLKKDDSIFPSTLRDMEAIDSQRSKMLHTEEKPDIRKIEVGESPKNKRKRQEEIDKVIGLKKWHIENDIIEPLVPEISEDEEKVKVQFCPEKQEYSMVQLSPQANEDLSDDQNTKGTNEEKEQDSCMVSTTNSQPKNYRPDDQKDYELGGNTPLKPHIESIVVSVTEPISIVNTEGVKHENAYILNHTEEENIIETGDVKKEYVDRMETPRDNSPSKDVLEESNQGLNIKALGNVEDTAEKNIEETKIILEQIVQPPTSSEVIKLPKNELSFSIERMLQPSSRIHHTPVSSAETVVSSDTRWEQTSNSPADTNKEPETFKHPGIVSIDKSDSKQDKISSDFENQRKRKIKKKEKSKVEEKRKVIVERVYSMNELAGGTSISPCLNLCSAPILPISTEFIPYRYGIYTTVNPTTAIGNSYSNRVGNEGLPGVSSYQPQEGDRSRSEYTTSDSQAEHNRKKADLSHSGKFIKDAEEIREPKTLKSENDIEIVQVEVPNKDLKVPQLENDETPRFIREDNIVESFRLNDEVKDVENSTPKTDNKHRLQSSEDESITTGVNKRPIDDGTNIEPRVKTADTRKSIESIVSCLKSKEIDKQAEFHSNDSRLRNELEILNTKKETEITGPSTIKNEADMSEDSCLDQSRGMENIAPLKKLESDNFIKKLNEKPDLQGESNKTEPISIPSYDVKGADDIVTEEFEATRGQPSKSECDTISHKMETPKVYPQTEVSSLFNSNLEQQVISDSFVNQVMAQSTGAEGMDGLLSSFQSAITESISSLQGSFSLFSNSSEDNIPFTPPNQNEGILRVNFQDKAVLPLSQPEVFINNRLNIPQSTPLRPQGTSQTDDSIFNISDDIFDFDFNTVNQGAVDGSYSNSYVNTTMSNENLQMFLDNPSELLHLLCNFSDVGCEVTVDNTNVEDIASNPSIAPGLIQEQLIDSIPPYIAEEEFDSNAPTDPMVGGQKELVPDPKQDPNLDEAPFPESALSFDEDMMHRYALFLHCDVNSTTQTTDTNGLNKEKVSKEPERTPVRHEALEKQQSRNELACSKNIDVSAAAMIKEQSFTSVPLQDTKLVEDDLSNSSNSKITEEPKLPSCNKREINKQTQNKSPKTSSPNNSTDSGKSTKKSNSKNPGKVQKIPASKYAPPKKQKSVETHQNKKSQEKAEVKQSKYSTSNEKVGNLTLDVDFNHSLDMPQLLSPTGNTSWKSKSLPASHNNKNESKSVESEKKELIAQSTPEKSSEDDANQQMQFNMYDRTKAMKRKAASVQNYFKFYEEDDNSNKNKKRKMPIKTDSTVPSNSPKIQENLESKDSAKEFDNNWKIPKIEDPLPEDNKESKIKKPEPVDNFKKNSHVRDLDYEFDKLKNSGPYKSSSSRNVGSTRTDRILRSAQEGNDFHHQMPSTSSQHNYTDRGKREDYRRYPDSNRKMEDSRRKPKVQDRSRSPHYRSSTYASTSSDYRRESSRRPTQQEVKRNDVSHSRNPQTCSEDRRRTVEPYHPRESSFKRVNRWLKRDCPDYHPPGPLFNRPYSNPSQQKKDSKRGDGYLDILDELYPLERNVYQNAEDELYSARNMLSN